MTFLLPFLLSFLVTLVITPIVIWIYKKNRWLDDPKTSSHPKIVHTSPLPRGGGIAIFVSLLLGSLLFLEIDKKIIGVLLGSTLLTLVGFWDDLKSPPPLLRLLFQLFAVLIVTAAGVGVAYVTSPFGGVFHLNEPQIALEIFGKLRTIWIVADLAALIWIVWCMNAVNFSTGLDGQMPGYVVIAALVIALASTRFASDPSQYNVILMSLIVAGAYLGFLFWNMYPQKILSGFGASNLAGFLLATLSILSGAKLATAMIVLAVPMIDALSVILYRLQHKGSPFQGDRSHFHHSLLSLGLSKRQVAWIYWICSGILGGAALLISSEHKLFVFLIILIVVCMIVQWTRAFTLSSKRYDHDNG